MAHSSSTSRLTLKLHMVVSLALTLLAMPMLADNVTPTRALWIVRELGRSGTINVRTHVEVVLSSVTSV